jgi:glycerol-3-phosphate O-acyltransferase
MNHEITISIWLFMALLLITGWAVLDRVFIPTVRGFFRRRINRILDEIGTRLDIEIKPIQLTKRQVLIDRLIYDPKVLEAIQEYSQKYDIPRNVLQSEVTTYAREIVPAFNAYLYFRLGYWFAKKIIRLLYRVRVGFLNGEKMSTIDPESTVVFIMNHRSNMDYVLVSFLVAERTTLSYAVGEWAKIWPLQTLIRAMGAFFVRRDSRNPLYRLVLERYIHMATKEGVCQAVFVEGGLSKDGRLQPPKMGFVDYMLRSFNPKTDRDIIFIPVGVNYDRTLEDRSVLRSLDPLAEKKSMWFVFKIVTRFIFRNLYLIFQSKWRRLGYACVNFGPYVSAREYCRKNKIRFTEMDRDQRFPYIEKLCNKFMGSIGRIIPILPISLVAQVLIRSSDRWLSELDIKSQAHAFIKNLVSKGASVFIPDRNREETIQVAFDMLKLRRMVIEWKGNFRAHPGSLDILSYYANIITDWEYYAKMKSV